MKDHQYQLINTRTMTSTRAMRSILRKRALNAGAQDSATGEAQCPQPLIAPAVAAQASGRPTFRANFQEMEFNFRGEQRHFILSRSLERCPHCHGTPMMKTEPMAVFSFEAKMGFAIFCPTCGNSTQLFNSSQSAIRNWTLAAKLQQ